MYVKQNNNAMHGRTMAIEILQRVFTNKACATNYVSNKIWVSYVYAGVQNRHHHFLICRVGLHPG